MSTLLHASLDVRGALTWPKRHLRGMFKDPHTGRLMSADECKEKLLDYLQSGTRYLPLGPCEGFNPESGCPGHPETP